MADQDVDLMAHLLRRAGFGASRDEIEAKLAQGFQDLLLLLSTDPAMIYYLDNCESHKDAVNENYGRELLELFSMGVGMDGEFNYTEDDVKACARAFTGWNIAPAPPFGPMVGPFGSSATTQLTTTTVRRPSWGKPAASMARISSTSSASSLPPPASSPGSCMTPYSPFGSNK